MINVESASSLNLLLLRSNLSYIPMAKARGFTKGAGKKVFLCSALRARPTSRI
jgi:hypothetical protein